MLKYKELLDYIVGILYELKLKQKQTGFFNIKPILASLKYPASVSDEQEIAKYLEAKGYVKGLYHLGGVSIEITPRGIIYIEEENLEILQKLDGYISDIEAKAISEEELSNPSPEQIVKVRKHIFELLDKTLEKVKIDFGPKGYDLEKDLSILKIELEKRNPDTEIIGSKLNTLSSIDSIRSFYKELVGTLNI